MDESHSAPKLLGHLGCFGTDVALKLDHVLRLVQEAKAFKHFEVTLRDLKSERTETVPQLLNRVLPLLSASPNTICSLATSFPLLDDRESIRTLAKELQPLGLQTVVCTGRSNSQLNDRTRSTFRILQEHAYALSNFGVSLHYHPYDDEYYQYLAGNDTLLELILSDLQNKGLGLVVDTFHGACLRGHDILKTLCESCDYYHIRDSTQVSGRSEIVPAGTGVTADFADELIRMTAQSRALTYVAELDMPRRKPLADLKLAYAWLCEKTSESLNQKPSGLSRNDSSKIE